MQEAGPLSTLYRGKLPVQYPYQYNGTYYLEGKQFQRGSVYYNGKLDENVLVNLDACKQELQVKVSENV